MARHVETRRPAVSRAASTWPGTWRLAVQLSRGRRARGQARGDSPSSCLEGGEHVARHVETRRPVEHSPPPPPSTNIQLSFGALPTSSPVRLPISPLIPIPLIAAGEFCERSSAVLAHSPSLTHFPPPACTLLRLCPFFGSPFHFGTVTVARRPTLGRDLTLSSTASSQVFLSPLLLLFFSPLHFIFYFRAPCGVWL